MKHRKRILTVADLHAILATMDPSAVILIPASSHEYRTPEVTVGTAMQFRKPETPWNPWEWWEDFGDLNSRPEEGDEPGERVAALIVG